eukprot:CAMPEP_0184018204 /NCGR_PEP_ID=MMETSP0954-20121128/8007_1 /TAXON_ID=627963 /ORGANISM="Aplanochytrium sp, Strain PBS07" /LENGTH=314 /DNA_ID=CAMNT_0026299615 /DNA_START=209 /DNA_END=1153 /DNA_ORIENTATION=+
MKPRLAWHYAAVFRDMPRIGKVIKDASKNACGSVDLSCYFLPVTSCPSIGKHVVGEDSDRMRRKKFPKGSPDEFNVAELVHNRGFDSSKMAHLLDSSPLAKIFPELKATREKYKVHSNGLYGALLYEYITRPKQKYRVELRRLVSELDALKIGKCAVMHVRRGDVKIMVGYFRKYHSIAEYVGAAHPLFDKHNISQIFLLTDSSLAIEEAEKQFPMFQWLYFKRQRFQADEGGFENQLPSELPITESLYLSATMELIKRCPVLVKSFSRLSDLFRIVMCAGRRNEAIKKVMGEIGCPDSVLVGSDDHRQLREKN